MRSTTRSAVGLLGVSALFVGLLCGADDAVDPPGTEAAEERIGQLQTERQSLLQQRLDMLKQGYLNGNVSHRQVVGATDDLLNAKLQDATDASERKDIHRSIIAHRRATANALESLFAAGKTTIDKVLAARAATIDARIAFYKEFPSADAVPGDD